MVVKQHLRLRCVASSCTSGEEAAERVRDLVSDRAFLSTSTLSSACLGKLHSFVMTCSGSADATVYLLAERPGSATGWVPGSKARADQGAVVEAYTSVPAKRRNACILQVKPHTGQGAQE